MENTYPLVQKILDLTMFIDQNYPELSKYLAEMRETLPDVRDPEVDEGALRAYCESLESMLSEYARRHEPTSAD